MICFFLSDLFVHLFFYKDDAKPTNDGNGAEHDARPSGNGASTSSYVGYVLNFLGLFIPTPSSTFHY
jgi:hypothetical protein